MTALKKNEQHIRDSAGRKKHPTVASAAPAAKSGTVAISGELPVHRLGFGAMQLTGRGVWGEPADRAEALIGDPLDAASVRAGVARVRPNAVINELTALPRHCTPAEMKAAAESDTRVRREGKVNLLAVMREAGVRRYVLQSSGFWYAPGPGLADDSSLQAVDTSPGVAAGARTYVELESTDFRVSEVDRVAMRYGFLYGPGTWFTNADDMGEQLRPQQVPVSGAGQGVAVSPTSRTPHPLRSPHSNVLQAPTTSLTTTRTSASARVATITSSPSLTQVVCIICCQQFQNTRVPARRM
jgi:hypothetical protein